MNSRYEEYLSFNNKIPFSLSIDLPRDKTNQSKESNWHENLEIQLCKSGDGFVLLNEKKYKVFKDDISIVNSNVIHYTGTNNKLCYSCLIIDSQFCENIGINPQKIMFKSLIKDKDLLNYFYNLEKTYLDFGDICRIARLNKIIISILIILREKYTICINKENEYNAYKTTKLCIKYIRENYYKKISLNELSKNAMVNKYSLSREFKKITKQTIIEYTNNYRCFKATELLRDGKSVSESARMCGFNNLSFFTKTFKNRFNVLPSQYSKNPDKYHELRI